MEPLHHVQLPLQPFQFQDFQQEQLHLQGLHLLMLQLVLTGTQFIPV
jgi:hypothetical protein